jgi:sterol desaturase/sphingolipid hydroxylase (fatty acid hydroxylase superfamily)
MTLKERFYRFRSFWIFPLAGAVLLFFTSRSEPQSRAPDLLRHIASGLLIWTFLEYLLHRFVFHTRIPIRNPRLRYIVNASHLGHHASPRDPNQLLVLPAFGAAISLLLFGLFAAISRSWYSAAGVMTGVWAGFLYYEAVHYRVHFSLAGGGMVAWQRKAHFYHHFTNNRRCFGVTSPIWDYVFGTTRPTSSAQTST